MKKMDTKDGKEIVLMQKELSPIAQKAEDVSITNEKQMVAATELLSKLNQLNDRIVEIKEQVTKPLNAALKAERSRWKPLEEMYEDAITVIRSKMSVYQTEQVRIRREKEMKIALRVKEGSGNLSLEKAAEKIGALALPQKEVATESGLVQFRETATLKISDASLIPREYLVVDEKKVLADLKTGVVVPGASIEMIQVAVNYR